ncbi:tyrosine-type recombinase/integrase [Parvibaculum sp.]|uniref:tyrosine-type recombinase/integrase n=1 Tax=Parvibaculum sp. TaxID=2024848 RepID=UPI00391BDD24
MPKRKLTAAAIDRLKPPASGQVDYFDAALPGFALRVSATGIKSFVVFCRVGGRLRRVTLGRWPALTLARAREKAGQAVEAAERGIDPVGLRRAARDAAADSVSAVAAEWLKRDQAGNRTYAEVKRVMERDVLPRWKHRNIRSITRRDALDLLDKIADRGAPVLARRVHAYLHRMFRWCVARGILEASPMTDLPKPGRERRRDRVLTDDELRLVWRAAEAIGWPFGPAIRLLILTGARRQEIAGLLRAEIAAERRQLEITPDRMKADAAHIIPLVDEAAAILAAVPKVMNGTKPSAYVFTTTGKTPISGWTKARQALDAKIEELRQADAAKRSARAKIEPLPDWRLHDIRRTVATGMQRLGIRLEVTEAVLGHVSGSRGGIVGVYQRHTYADEKRAALEAWAAHVARIVNQRPAKVISLRRRK